MNRSIKHAIFCLVFLAPISGTAETVVANRVIRGKSIIQPGDIITIAAQTPGAHDDIAQVVGMEARTVLYPGRPIGLDDIGPPAVIERNQIVTLIYVSGTLAISVEGRSLGRGGVGDTLRVMNMSSRSTVQGVIQTNSEIRVMP